MKKIWPILIALVLLAAGLLFALRPKAPEQETLPVTIADPAPELAQAHELNGDTKAWLSIPGTGIDLPVQHAADSVQVDLGLDAADDCVDLILRQVHAQNFLQGFYRVLLKFRREVFVVFDLLNHFFNFLFDQFHTFLLLLQADQNKQKKNRMQA